jgi:hypothetical protein
MAWWQVQAASMNPRVRILLPIQRRLSSLLIFLQQRWRLKKYTTVSFHLIATFSLIATYILISLLFLYLFLVLLYYNLYFDKFIWIFI